MKTELFTLPSLLITNVNRKQPHFQAIAGSC